MGACRSTQVVPITETETARVIRQNLQFQQLQQTIVNTIHEEVNKTFRSSALLNLIKKAVSDVVKEYHDQVLKPTEISSYSNIEAKLISLFDEQTRALDDSLADQTTSLVDRINTTSQEVNKTVRSSALLNLIKKAVSDVMKEYHDQVSETTESSSYSDIEAKLTSLFEEQTRALDDSLADQTTSLVERINATSQEVNKTVRSSALLNLIKKAVSDVVKEYHDQVLKPTEASSYSVIEATLTSLFKEQMRALDDSLADQTTSLVDLIKQAVLGALTNPRATTTTSREQVGVIMNANRLFPRVEVKISADPKLTRIDAAFMQQRDAVVNNQQLRDYVRQWSKVNAMDDLCDKIKATGKNNLERAWLLFCWIGENIRYNLYCNNNAAESVFRTRVGVCRGYVSLYHECCSLLSIPCSEISGFAKQAFLKPGEELKNSPHAWNAIVLDNYTYLLDPTWGAGGGDGGNKLEDFYFLTSPEQLIYTHYCNSFQLLKPELTKQEFLSLPIMKSTYYRLKMNLLSPKQGFNETNEAVFKISVQAPSHIHLIAMLKVENIEYPRNLHTFCQRDATNTNVYHCYLAPPADGLYEIVCKENSSDDNADNNLQIDKKLRNYASLDNDAESKNFLEQHHEFISTA
ncbi:unnamed protein product [Adineta steineri]|uniref:Transglutaminase-like domain-containing protein n=1 Tax=Adineta steineri TaxID=433720 RepID=A0A815FEK1_9BILA|nr:unnamed protein product [Adineta steineri]